METITFKGKQYKVVQNHPINDLLSKEGLVSQMTIVGARDATKLLQIWNTRFGQVYKTISASARLEVELK